MLFGVRVHIYGAYIVLLRSPSLAVANFLIQSTLNPLPFHYCDFLKVTTTLRYAAIA